MAEPVDRPATDDRYSPISYLEHPRRPTSTPPLKPSRVQAHASSALGSW